MALNAGFLRRQSRFPQGISTGGGDTGAKPLPQPTLFAAELNATTTTQEMVFPKGTLLIAGVMLPKGPSASDSWSAATTGDIKINKITGGAGGSVSTEYFANAAVESYVRTVLNSGAGYLLADETRIRFTATGLDGVGRLAIEVILPPTNP